MPLSKPVKKQQLLLPSPKDFNLLGKDKKENILKRLSTDNLIIYLEYIVASFHTQTKADSFTLEQIVEDEIRLGSSYSDEDSFISDWITKNADRSSDLEASLLEQSSSNYAMASTKAITQTLLGSSPSPIEEQPKSNARLGKVLQDLSNFVASPSVNSSSTQKQAGEMYPNQTYAAAVSPNLTRSTRVKNAWDNVLQPSSVASRWQTNFASGKENMPQFKAAIERPSSGLGLRFGNESVLNGSSSSYFSKGAFNKIPKMSLTQTYKQDAFLASANQSSISFDDKSGYSQYSVKPLGNSFDNSMEHSNSFGSNDFSSSTPSHSRSDFGSSLLMPTNSNTGNYFEYKQGQSDENDRYSQFDPLFMKSPSKQQPSSERPEPFRASSKSPENSSSIVAVDQLKTSATDISLDLKDSDLLATFNLPEPTVFNEMAAESRIKILSALPDGVKNKYEYVCWSHKLDQLYNERPVGMDIPD